MLKSNRIKAAVVTVSDKASRGEREDKSGEVVSEVLSNAKIDVLRREVVADELEELKKLLIELSDSGFDLIVTTGGTGISPRDITPEATLSVVQKEIPGMAEAMRFESRKKTPYAMISRAVCGMRGRTIIINLPGSPSGARECLEVVMPAIPHAVEVASGSAHECASK